MKVERLHEAIRKATQETQETQCAYTSQIEDVLQKHPSGLQLAVLRQTHDRIVKELESAFTTRVLTIRKNEPIETHWRPITMHIEDYWLTCVVPANERTLSTPAPAPPSAAGTSTFKHAHALI